MSMAEGTPADTDLVELTIGAPAHGGHAVARLDGRVVFVRHAIPGERVLARLTESAKKSFWRADAVTILEASPDRVPSAWPEAGPGGVGGGELAHVSLPGQRRWKTQVLREQLVRLGGVDPDVADTFEVRGVDDNGLGWRTRIELVTDRAGRAGMAKFRSHDVIALDGVPLATEAVSELAAREKAFTGTWRAGARIRVAAPAGGDPGLVTVDGVPWHHGRADHRPSTRRTVVERVSASEGSRASALLGGQPLVYRVAADGFWQVHRQAPEVLITQVLGALDQAAGGAWDGLRVMDLYSGAGLFSLPLARAGASVLAVEGDGRAVRDARRNTRDADVEHAEGDVSAVLGSMMADGPVRADAVVLDPPRTGAGREVVDQIAAATASTVVYVACDPAALARDVATFTGHGFTLDSVTGLDLFPMTHHMETVAVLTR